MKRPLAIAFTFFAITGDARAYNTRHTCDDDNRPCRKDEMPSLVRWNSRRIAVSFEASWPDEQRGADFPNHPMSAISGWNNVVGADFQYELNRDGRRTGVIFVSFVPNGEWIFADDVLGLTFSTFDTKDGRMKTGEILLNGSHPFPKPGVRPTADEFDFDRVLLHEAGHALGLDHPAEPDSAGNEPPPVMVIEQPPGELGILLTADDEAGVRELYPADNAGCSCQENQNDGRTGRGVLLFFYIAFLVTVVIFGLKEWL